MPAPAAAPAAAAGAEPAAAPNPRSVEWRAQAGHAVFKTKGEDMHTQEPAGAFLTPLGALLPYSFFGVFDGAARASRCRARSGI